MAWTCERKATDEDYERLQKTARRFLDRHFRNWQHLKDPGTTYENILDIMISSQYPGDIAYFNRLWLRCVRRALRSRDADGIAYGYVGCHID